MLEAAVAANVRSFVMTSSTTVFGDALIPPPGRPATWIDESVVPVPKNMYGVTKASAEDLCHLAHRNDGLSCIVLRTSRFFAESDDMPQHYGGRSEDNIKANEYACRRVALEDAVDAHLRAAERAPHLGFGRYVVSATTPFTREDMAELRLDAASVFARRSALAAAVWKERGWRFPERLDRVYVNDRARRRNRLAPTFRPQRDRRPSRERRAGPYTAVTARGRQRIPGQPESISECSNRRTPDTSAPKIAAAVG